MKKTYSELITFKNFEDRFNYLKLTGVIGAPTFGGHRTLNQTLYQSPKWRSVRREVIFRDNGCDLAHEDYQIPGQVFIHHINPITVGDILDNRSCVFNLENLVCVSFQTHQAIHYGTEELLPKGLVVRKKNDTCLWR